MSRQRCWVPPGEPVSVAGHHIPGGLIYCGQHLRSATGAVEPALVDPELPVAPAGPGRAGPDPGARASYHLLSPAGRGAYLEWLAGGRRDTRVPAAFPLLFLFGLERRVLVDADHDPGVRRELPAIAAELRRLRSAYGGDATLHAAGGKLLEVIELVGAARPRPGGSLVFAAPPPPPAEPGPVPMALRIALARAAVSGIPVPADWARGWLWHHPALPVRTPQQRCPREYERLFALRYARRCGAGLVIQATGTPIRLAYQPVSPGLATVVIDRPDLPDVLTEPRATRVLGELLDEVSAALDAYSRWLARHPDGRGSLAATALLPPELVDQNAGQLAHLRAWALAHLDGRPSAVIDAAELDVFWSCADPSRMSRDEAEGLALVLGRAGFGIEPDVRFAGPALAGGPAVLFNLDVHNDPDGAGPGGGHARPVTSRSGASAPYRVAATAVDLAADLLAARMADGLDEDALLGMVAGIVAEVPVAAAPATGATGACLIDGELARLGARLRWQLAGGANPRRLARRAAGLSAAERAATGRFLITVAVGVTGTPSAVVEALTGAYRMLGLDPGLVFTRLHAASAAGARVPSGAPGGAAGPAVPEHAPAEGAALEPVVVRRSRGPVAGHPLPWALPEPASPPVTEHVRLDRALIERRLTETADVSALLGAIFAAEEPGPAQPGTGPAAAEREGSPAGPPPVAGLDRAHSELLRELVSRPHWPRAEFVLLAGRHGVLPDGALDLLNEVAMEAAGEPVLDGDDDLSVNEYAVQELLG